jgi:hypothetical protein
VSLAHRVAIDTLSARCVLADAALVADMAWQVVVCAR